MPETYNLDPDAIPVGSIEEFDDFKEAITLFTTTEGRKAWYYIPDDVFNDYMNYFIYFGYADDGPLGQPHNSFVRVYLADGPDGPIDEEATDVWGDLILAGPRETAIWEKDSEALLRGELPPMD